MEGQRLQKNQTNIEANEIVHNGQMALNNNLNPPANCISTTMR